MNGAMRITVWVDYEKVVMLVSREFTDEIAALKFFKEYTDKGYKEITVNGVLI